MAISKFCCWRATIPSHAYTVEAKDAREAAIKAASIITEAICKWSKDSIFITVKNDKDIVETWRVSIQRKFTLDEE